jgi:hypothetical protein
MHQQRCLSGSAASSSSSRPSGSGAVRPAAAAAAAAAAAGKGPARALCRPRRRRPLSRPPRAVDQQPPPEAATTATAAADALRRSINKTAATFAPRQSGAAKPNPAYRGSWLYAVFEAQAWLAVLAGGLLSFNVLLPTDGPSIPRLMGMWSVWVFTVPSLRARECTPKEKDALNVLFLLLPLVNVTLPLAWRSFAAVFTADVLALAAVYAWKGAWGEVYGLGGERMDVIPGSVAAAAAAEEQQEADE